MFTIAPDPIDAVNLRSTMSDPAAGGFVVFEGWVRNHHEAREVLRLDTFCDIRQRRGVRGATYAFANSQRLQVRLAELGIRYLHRKDLAPTKAMREVQAEADKASALADAMEANARASQLEADQARLAWVAAKIEANNDPSDDDLRLAAETLEIEKDAPPRSKVRR